MVDAGGLPEKKAPVFTTVDRLRPDTSGHNLIVKVLDSKLVLKREVAGSGTSSRVAECLVGDGTGVIVFTARNSQVDTMQVGKYVTLRNSKIDMFRGQMRLGVNSWGKVEEAPAQDFVVKEDFNLSNVEFELVQLPEVGSSIA